VTCPAGHDRRGERPRLELADVFRTYGDRLPELTPHQARTVQAITSCRTAALGGHRQQCDHCGYSVTSYNSCRNRHCPKCQGLDDARWVESQQQLLLPTEYHHVVFTIPQPLHPLLLANPRAGYGLLFWAVAETLQEVAERPRNLGARIGFTAVLHTWTQTLDYHPHVHCIVTGGGLSPDATRWLAAPPGFLFSVRILSRVFRGTFLRTLQLALDRGRLRFEHRDGHARLRQAARQNWVVYSKPPVSGPEQVLRYLGRYTHRIAISNHRLVAMQDGQVTFRWRDRARGDQPRLMTLEAAEFLRRYLLHLLPPGFRRIRHYGLLANACRATHLAACKALLGAERQDDPEPSQDAAETWQELLARLTGDDPTRCPQCRQGRLRIVESLAPLALPMTPAARIRPP
jgi:predicted Zn-ribbon and HTH transcriptional regulator